MIRTIIKSYFFIFVFIAAVIYELQQLQMPLFRFINNYFNDILCIPIVLKLGQYLIRYIKSDPYLNIPITLQITITVLYSLLFEVVVPQFKNRYTSDWLDVIAYFSGLSIYWLMELLNLLDKRD